MWAEKLVHIYFEIRPTLVFACIFAFFFLPPLRLSRSVILVSSTLLNRWLRRLSLSVGNFQSSPLHAALPFSILVDRRTLTLFWNMISLAHARLCEEIHHRRDTGNRCVRRLDDNFFILLLPLVLFHSTAADSVIAHTPSRRLFWLRNVINTRRDYFSKLIVRWTLLDFESMRRCAVRHFRVFVSLHIHETA